LGKDEKANADDWPQIAQYLESGYNILSIDPRGLGETRMQYKAVSPDDPTLVPGNIVQAYRNPLSSVLAGYVYNSILTGRPYFLQIIEDAEIGVRFARAQLSASDVAVTGSGGSYTLANAISETLPQIKVITPTGVRASKWSEIVDQKRELWPIEDLLPGGAYIQ
jgi:hypothetical protein